MERSIFLGRLMAGASMTAAVARLHSVARPTNIPAPVQLAPRDHRKHRAIAFDGACRLSVWSGIKKRMRRARRDAEAEPYRGGTYSTQG